MRGLQRLRAWVSPRHGCHNGAQWQTQIETEALREVLWTHGRQETRLTAATGRMLVFLSTWILWACFKMCKQRIFQSQHKDFPFQLRAERCRHAVPSASEDRGCPALPRGPGGKEAVETPLASRTAPSTGSGLGFHRNFGKTSGKRPFEHTALLLLRTAAPPCVPPPPKF